MASGLKEEPSRFPTPLFLCAVLVLGAVVRLILLFASDFVIDSDEAIVGLMAKHITEGRTIPVFYYGQYYMGSLEALVVAGAFELFGRSNEMLKAVPFVFSLVQIVVVYFLGREVGGQNVGRIAAFFTALAPSAFVLWSTKTRGGFIELVVIGTLCLLLACRMIRTQRYSAKGIIGLGLLLGVGWWVNNQIIFYMAAIGGVFLVLVPQTVGFVRALYLGALGISSFLVGGAPFWYANLTASPAFPSFEMLSRGAGESGAAIRYFVGFLTEALPIIFGARRFWSDIDLFFGSSVLAYGVYAIALSVVFYVMLLDSARRESRGLLALLLVFIAMVALIFSLSGFGWLSKAPRYLLPLYSVLFVLLGVAITKLQEEGYAWLAATLLVLVTSLHLFSNYWNGVSVPGQPIVYDNQRVQADQRPLYEWLQQEGYRHVRTNYWIGYRLAFETDERVTFSTFREPKEARIAEYESIGREIGDFAPYVLVPRQAEMLTRSLTLRGISYRENSVGGYTVIDELQPWKQKLEPVSLEQAYIEVSSRENWQQRLVDDDLGTRWGSGMPQHPGMTIDITLPEARRIAGVTLEHGFWPQDAARRLAIIATTIDGEQCTVVDMSHDDWLFEGKRTWQFYFKPVLATHIQLRQQGVHPVFDWSVADIKIFALPAGSEVNETKEVMKDDGI